jgi:purine-binding chemotaxis protein CheW
MSTSSTGTAQFLTAYVNGHYLGFPISNVQDVTGPQDITGIPRSHESVAGILNLRGRIVCAVDMNRRFNEPSRGDAIRFMGIIVESRDELFSMLVDKVEDVLTIDVGDIEKAPVTLNPVWHAVCSGVYQIRDKIMIIVDPEKILDIEMTGV